MALKAEILRAAKAGSVQNMKALLKKPEARSLLNDKTTPENSLSHAAVENPHPVEMVQLLVNNGADKDFTNHLDKTVLHLASAKGHSPLVEYLLRSGSSVTKVDKDGNNPLHCAVKFGNLNTVKCIVEKLDKQSLQKVLTDVNKAYKTPLLMTADCLSVEIFDILIKYGADPSQTGENECTMLHGLSKHPFTVCQQVLEYFLKSVLPNINDKQFINKGNKDGHTALHIAVQQDRLETVKMLIKYHADPKMVDNEGFNLIHQSAVLGKTETIQWLFSNNQTELKPIINLKVNDTARYKSASINSTMAAPGFTAVHLALSEGYPEIIQSLLEYGADPEVKDGKDRSPLDLSEMIVGRVQGEKREDIESCTNVLVKWIHEHTRQSFRPTSAARRQYMGHEKKDILEGMSDIEKSLDEFKKVIKTQIDGLKQECQDLVEEKKQETNNLNTEKEQNKSMENTINELEKCVQESTDKIIEVVEKQRQAVVDDIDETIEATNSFYLHQYNDTDVFNDYTYFRIFLKISYEVGHVKGSWVKLLDNLMKNYPKSFTEAIKEEISGSCVSEKECSLEVLTRWKVYSSTIIEKLDRLKEALQEINMKELVEKIDEIIKDNIDSGADDMRVNLTDSALDSLARKVGNEWRNIGIQLGYERAELDRFEINNNNQLVESTKAMFINWRDNTPGVMNFKFGVLAEAFKSANRMDLAKEFMYDII